MNKSKLVACLAVVAAVVALNGCAMSSHPMQADDGTYIITAAAAPIRGGAAGATSVAFDDAQKFCSQQGMSARVVDFDDRDVYQSAYGSSFNGSFNKFGGGFRGGSSGGTFAAGRTNLRFKCARG